jgi:NiFe hydrogenase small subunit HydA
MAWSTEPFPDELERRGVSRRQFLSFCGVMASVLALPKSMASAIAEAIETKPKPTLVWLEFQDCAGNSESFLRSGRPSAADIILDALSIDYHETIMAAAGHQAEQALDATVKDKHGEYLVVVEGSIPTGAGGAYCTIGGRAAIDIVREVCDGAAATIAIGTCASFGGIPAASPNPTGALSVADAVPGIRNLINLPACPANAENLAALVVYFLIGDRSLPTGSRSTTAANGAPTTTPVSTSSSGETRPTARASASTRWDARVRCRSRTARPSAGTRAPAGRSAAATRASAAPSRTSGTR